MDDRRCFHYGPRAVELRGAPGDTALLRLPEPDDEAALRLVRVVGRPDAVIIDVGANLGTVAIGFALAAPAGVVVACEPSPDTFARMEANVRRAGCPNVVARRTAVGDVAGTARLHETSWFSAGSFLAAGVATVEELHPAVVEVPLTTVDALVDDLHPARVDLLKVDVEGHELAVLRGARRTIERWRPAAVVEFNVFTLTTLAGQLPLAFLREVRACFPYVYDYRVGRAPQLVATDADAFTAVLTQFREGRPTDLLCLHRPLEPAQVAELARPAPPSASAGAVGDDATDELARTRHALEDATRQLAALRSSTSWRVTRPVRWLGGLAGRRRRRA